MARKKDEAVAIPTREAIRYKGNVGTVANSGLFTGRPRSWKLDDQEIGTRNVGDGENEVSLSEASELVDLGCFEWAPRKAVAETPAEPAPEEGIDIPAR